MLGTVDQSSAHAHRARRRGLPAPGRDLPGATTSTSTSNVARGRPRRPRLLHLGPRGHRHRDRRRARSTRRWGDRRLSLRAGPGHPPGGVVPQAPRCRRARCSARSRSTCPSARCETTAVWWTLPADVLEDAGLAARDLPGAAHAAEHASIGLLPLFATCDRWDIGGVSTALHPDTGQLTVFVYDGHPGGAGFAERGFRAAARVADRHPGGDRVVPVRRAAARRACSRPSAATATTRSTRPAADPRCSTCLARDSRDWDGSRPQPEGPMLVLGLILVLIAAGALVAVLLAGSDDPAEFDRGRSTCRPAPRRSSSSARSRCCCSCSASS